MGAHLATKTVGAPVSSLHHRQTVKNLKYSTHKGDVFFDDDLSAIKENSKKRGEKYEVKNAHWVCKPSFYKMYVCMNALC